VHGSCHFAPISAAAWQHLVATPRCHMLPLLAESSWHPCQPSCSDLQRLTNSGDFPGHSFASFKGLRPRGLASSALPHPPYPPPPPRSVPVLSVSLCSSLVGPRGMSWPWARGAGSGAPFRFFTGSRKTERQHLKLLCWARPIRTSVNGSLLCRASDTSVRSSRQSASFSVAVRCPGL